MSVKVAFIRAATALALATTLTIPVKGIPVKHEVRQLKVVVEATGKASAAGAAFNFDNRDWMQIVGTGANGGVFKKLRLTYNDRTDAINLSPAEMRILAVYANGRDPFPEYSPFRGASGGAGVLTQWPAAAGAAQAFKVCLPFTFYDSNLEFPNVGCPSSLQLNRDGVEVNLETDAANIGVVGTATLVLTSGSLNVTVGAIKLYATTSKVPADYVAPTQYQRTRRLTQQPDTEKGPFWERFLAIETDPLTYEAQVSSITIEIDQVTGHRNAAPTEYAALFGATAQQDGILPLDIVKNSLNGPFTPSSNQAGTSGLTVTPLMWQDGQAQDDESEWNIARDYRTITMNLASAGDPTATLLYWRTAPIDEARDLIRTMLSERGLAGVSFDDLAVKGGDAQAMFKPRWFARRSAGAPKGPAVQGQGVNVQA
jgi:hypothetical protein